jgi:hypothetical protein
VTSIVPIETRGRPGTRGFWRVSSGSGSGRTLEGGAEAAGGTNSRTVAGGWLRS